MSAPDETNRSGFPLPVWSGEDADEFPVGPGVILPRRAVLKGAGAAAAMTALGACFRQPPREMLPYSKTPDRVRPGLPLHFATCTSLGGYAVGLLVQSHEGHPQNIQGNPEHPWSQGATGAYEQAELLGLYDPGRLSTCSLDGSPVSRQGALEHLVGLAERARDDGGARLRILAEPDGSPSLQALHARIRERLPRARFVHWSALSESESTAGAQLAFGTPLTTVPDLAEADVILSLDADLLATFPGHLPLARAVAARRVPEAKLNRLYVVETATSLTGMFADHRRALVPSDIEAFAIALAHAVAKSGTAPEFQSLVAGVERPVLDEGTRRFVDAVARDLVSHRGRSAVICGRAQPARVHALAHALNAALGNAGRTVRYCAPVLPVENAGPAALHALVEEIDRGQVDTLVVTAWNPVYTAPADIDLGAALARVRNTVYASLRPDATSRVCRLVVSRTHFLESWGDGRAPDGTVGFVQPLIQPLFDGVSDLELFAALAGEVDKEPYELVREHWGGSFRDWIRLGVIPGSHSPEAAAALNWEQVGGALRAWRPAAGGGGLHVSFAPDYSVYDGRYAHNAWLQELPDPVTKIVWDNAAYIAPATARRLGVDNNDVVRLSLRGRSIEAPIHVVPGHAEDAVTLPLGYGLNGGFDAGRLRTTEGWWSSAGLELERTGKKQALAQTQLIADTQGRKIALSRRLQDWDPSSDPLAELREAVPTLYDPWKYDAPHKWGMTLDVSRCTGCSACIVACQSENNIPTVGKEQVARGREMHWLRVDRYFLGDSSETSLAITQPLMCVHCEHAPCEYVCPVNATVHSDEGLNEMIYNRCVGTRYCSNNCPYKVRRFNFLDYYPRVEPLETLYKNPDVTVRARGVMEKCSWCVQRIERARIDERIRGSHLRDGELQTACQQACPTQAITFGDLNDPSARVTALHEDPRAWELLHDLGTRPRTRHLLRITNPNPELA